MKLLNTAISAYPDFIDATLRPKPSRKELVIDLFAGCGGLGLGFESVGFRTIGYEMNADCCVTYNRNLSGSCSESYLTPDTVFPPAEVVIGGPPCQPFSVGGHQRGLEDSRDGFPAFISAVEQLRPKLWLFENVRGLLYKNKWYLEQIIRKLESLEYLVDIKLLNASCFSVPQNRERLIVVGHKGGYKFPIPANRIITAGEALGDSFSIHPENARYLTESMDAYVAKYEKASQCINPRDLNPHRPARTVTCRNLGGATGDMHRIRLEDGRRRRLTVREGALLQSFPQWFEFSGSEISQYNQIGNAVAPMFARALAESVLDYLDEPHDLSAEFIQSRRSPQQTMLELAGSA